jgi:hypothetical protein
MVHRSVGQQHPRLHSQAWLHMYVCIYMYVICIYRLYIWLYGAIPHSLDAICVLQQLVWCSVSISTRRLGMVL